MAKMYVAFVLHFYQPSTQSSKVVEAVTRESYLPLAKLFNVNTDLNPKFTVSITGSLLDLLEKCRLDTEILSLLRQAQQANKIEIIHSGAYYPIFPLMPESEIQRQIELDISSKQNKLGVSKKTGIFSPELCYDDCLIDLYKSFDFQWTLIGDQLMDKEGIEIPEQRIYCVNELCVFMRSQLWSDRLTKPQENGKSWTGKDFVEALAKEVQNKENNCYKIIALNAETFGHHIKYFQETFLRDMLYAIEDTPDIELCLVSELLEKPELQKTPKQVEPNKDFKYFPPSSWATNIKDASRGDFYPHWQSQGNPVHENLWKLTRLLLEACRNIDFSNNKHKELRIMFDQAFYSETYYFASIWFWRPELVHRGIDLQMRALYKYCRLTNNTKVFQEGKQIYVQLMREVFIETGRRGFHEGAAV
jgi:alpha-amylase/alpha-mannosidase (GH57 family)